MRYCIHVLERCDCEKGKGMKQQNRHQISAWVLDKQRNKIMQLKFP